MNDKQFPIPRSVFIDTIEAIRDAYDKERSFSDDMDKYNDSSSCFNFSGKLQYATAYLLENLFDPALSWEEQYNKKGFPTGDITWWCFETDFGRNDCNYAEIEGKSYIIDTPERLYDLITGTLS